MLFVKRISKLSPVTVKNTFARNYCLQRSTSETFISRASGKNFSPFKGSNYILMLAGASGLRCFLAGRHGLLVGTTAPTVPQGTGERRRG